MDYEKAYKEAIKRAKAIIEVAEKKEEVYKSAITIFPELRESEGERIRRNIIAALKGEGYYDCDLTNECIAWLEKQGDQKSVDKEYTFKSIPRLLDMIEPTDRAKSYCKKLIDSLQTEGYSVDAKIVGECLKQMNGEKVAMAVMDTEKQDEQKPQRMVSAEAKEALYDKPTDEEMKELLRTEYEKGRADTLSEMKSSWSEEDEKILNNLIDYIKVDDALQYSEKQVVNWLKSLKQRHTWKPSDEQMNALDSTLQYSQVSYNSYEHLNSLYNDLKKLTE